MTDWIEAWRFAWAALWSHKTRTLLTGLSMLIANASVILVVSVALTGRDFVVRQIEGVGSNLIYAYYEAGGNVSASEADYITVDDLVAVREGLGDTVTAAAAVISAWDWIPIDGRPQQIRVLGSNVEYRRVRNLEILSGRYFDDADIAERAKVALLTPELAGKLFGSAEGAVGEPIKIQGLRFQVVGVFEEGVETFGQSEVASNSALIPISVMRYFSDVERVDPLYVSIRSQAEVPAASSRIRQILEARHRPGSLYRVDNLAGVLDAAKNISLALTVVLLLIAAITLAISGIFIMNIMLIAVSERTKEIGVRMAVGARRRQVQRQFLLEAVGISLLGGSAGVSVGVAIPLLARRIIDSYVLGRFDAPALAELQIPVEPWSIVAALVVSVAVGAVFGFMPASRAAQLNPVDALRHE